MRGGYFVEFGAADGMNLSNTYLLEKEYVWTGIVAEPAQVWHEALKANRSCHIEADCVWRESNATLNFCESDAKEYSTIDSYNGTHENSGYLKTERSYSVKTISLGDLLAKYNAPARVDYLSIDTEGSEYEILSNHDFGRYGFSVITVENNFAAAREQLFEQLTSKGYLRKFEEISRFDDWYVLPQ